MPDSLPSFGNSFWGPNDLGVSVLLDRMRDAKTTNEEVGQFYQERASIEEEYAQKLSGLASRSLGNAELGTLQASMKILVQETNSIADSHASIARQIKIDLVDTHTLFSETMLSKRRKIQKSVEELFRIKIQRQVELKKAKEQCQLEPHQRTAQAAGTTLTEAKRDLTETIDQWNTEWRSACDRFQKLEEERIDTVKTGMWAYANIFSQACVTDDESCERLRISLEKCDAKQDIAIFIKMRGTGNVVPTSPEEAHARYASKPAEHESLGRCRSLAARSSSSHVTTDSNTKATDAPQTQTKQGNVINQYPLDGITQLCRSDSSATFASNSTSMAGSYVTASSIYSSVPNSQGQTPNLNVASGGFNARDVLPAKMQRKKSFIERVDMWPRRSPSPSKTETPKPLKAQKTGSSIFDALRPARSRSRASMRTETQNISNSQGPIRQDSMLNIGQNMLPVQSSHDSVDKITASNSDPIAAALQQLRLESTAPVYQEQAEDLRSSRSYGELAQPQQPTLAPRAHRRYPSRSESSSPVLHPSMGFTKRENPNKYVTQNGASTTLDVPPAAHSAAEMRSMTDDYSQKTASILNRSSPSRESRAIESHEHPHSSRGRTSSNHSAQQRKAPGNLRRSPSPHPPSHTSREVLENSYDAVRRPLSVASNCTVRPQQSPSHTRMTYDEQYIHDTNDNPMSMSKNNYHEPSLDDSMHLKHISDHENLNKQMRRGRSQSRAQQSFVDDTVYIKTNNRHSLMSPEMTRQAVQPTMRARSKSFIDAPRQRAQFTRNGRQILTFVLALYEYKATIPEEISFRQGDTLAIVEMREDGWWIGEVTDEMNAVQGLVPSNFFKRLDTFH